MCDCTSLTQAGYVGEDVESVIQKLLENSDGVVGTAQVSITLTGATINQCDIVSKLFRTIGFGSQFVNLAEDIFDKDEIVASNRKNSLLKMVEASDLIQFGFVPELVGRFPVLVPFHSFDHETLLRVMKEPKNNIIQQAQRLFKIDGIQLKFTQGALNEIAKQAIQKKTGARALRSIIEKVLLAPKFECLGGPVTTVIVTAGVVRGEAQYFTNYRSNESLDISLY
uniref:ClpB_D2-small domain-containing protein n=1 Tax=Heterorhabditis bacteriophora TaxID=37862 RepID=A0A1I7XFC0_HETBA